MQKMNFGQEIPLDQVLSQRAMFVMQESHMCLAMNKSNTLACFSISTPPSPPPPPPPPSDIFERLFCA